MNALINLRGWVVLAVLMLALAGCGSGNGTGGGDDKSPDAGAADNGSASLVLTSYARTGGVSAAGKSFFTASVPATVEVSGEILIVNKDANTSQSLSFKLSIDEGSLQVLGDVVLALQKGNHDFYFLLHSGDQSYAGIIKDRYIFDAGENKIDFVLSPVISTSAVAIKEIQNLVLFRFKFDSEEIKSYSDPAFSIRVNNGKEHLYNINTATGLGYVYVLLPAGTYTFELKFYDAGNLKLVASREVTLPTEGDLEIEVTQVVTEVSYQYVPGSSPDLDAGTITFYVPAAIVQEAGGGSTLLATAAVVGPLTPLVETVLPLKSEGAAYFGTMDVPLLTAGGVAYAIQFRDSDVPQGQAPVLFAFCAGYLSIDAATAEQPTPQGTAICEPHTIVRKVVTNDPAAPVEVNVVDNKGGVAGAVVIIGDEPIGITNGKGLNSTLFPQGILDAFLRGDTYLVKAEHAAIGATGDLQTRAGEGSVALAPGQPGSLTIELSPLEEEPEDEGEPPEDDGDGEPIGQFTLTASRYGYGHPDPYQDAREKVRRWTRIRIPTAAELKVTAGSQDQYLAIVYFGRGVKCWYMGGKWDSALTGWIDRFFYHTFHSPACTYGRKAGDTLWVRGSIKARVVRGTPGAPVTTVEIPIQILQILEDGKIDEGKHRGWWRGWRYDWERWREFYIHRNHDGDHDDDDDKDGNRHDDDDDRDGDRNGNNNHSRRAERGGQSRGGVTR